MLKVRVIPILLWKDFGLVKGVGFNSWRRVGSVLPSIKIYNQRDVDELVFVDIVANRNQSAPNYGSLDEYAGNCFVPLTVGGGVSKLTQVHQLLRVGADKVSINTAAYECPTLITEVAKRYGEQCVVVSIDVKRMSEGKWSCFSYSGSQIEKKDVCSWAKEVERRGAGEILLTSIDCDGKMDGYDLSLIESVVSSVNIPVVASGGAGDYQDMVNAVVSAGASAVAAASMFHFTEQTPAGAKEALRKAGVPVRST